MSHRDDIVAIDVSTWRVGGHGVTYALENDSDLGIIGMVKGYFGVSSRNILEQSLIKAVEYARLLCPVKTGALRDSIDYVIENDGKSGFFGSILNQEVVTYASYVNDGTIYREGVHFLEGALDMIRSDLS